MLEDVTTGSILTENGGGFFQDRPWLCRAEGVVYTIQGRIECMRGLSFGRPSLLVLGT